MSDYGSTTVGALDRAWRTIQQHNPDVPDAVIILGTGKQRGSLKYGHYHRDRWAHAADDNRVPEILISGEGIQRGARDTLGTLIHEAAHALAKVRDIKDTSRQGRYHNKRFKKLAEDMGLEIGYDDYIGHSPTTVPDATAELYADTIADLDKHLSIVIPGEPPSGEPRPKRTAPHARCLCDPPRKLRMAKAEFFAAAITCDACGEAFGWTNQD